MWWNPSLLEMFGNQCLTSRPHSLEIIRLLSFVELQILNLTFVPWVSPATTGQHVKMRILSISKYAEEVVGVYRHRTMCRTCILSLGWFFFLLSLGAAGNVSSIKTQVQTYDIWTFVMMTLTRTKTWIKIQINIFSRDLDDLENCLENCSSNKTFLLWLMWEHDIQFYN